MELSAAENLALDHMTYWLCSDWGWEFKWSRAVTYFGWCKWNTRDREDGGVIRLSKPITELNTEDHVLDTVLHEIAHALAPYDANHGYEWKVEAARVGADPTRCYDTAVATPPRPWISYCEWCGKDTGKVHRRRQHMIHKGCGGTILYRPNPEAELGAIELPGMTL